MIWVFGLFGIFLAGVVVGCAGLVLTAQPACAALPPLSDDELAAVATYTVTGTVKAIRMEEVTTDVGSDCRYSAVIAVTDTESSRPPRPSFPGMSASPPTESTDPAVGEEIIVHYWQAGQRPAGWTGNGGQSSLFSEGMAVKLFLTKTSDGELHLLEPNGWEAAE